MESKPHFDVGCRTLLLCGIVVKQYRRAAETQSLILDAFEQAGWPARIISPNSAREAISRDVAKWRLRNAIAELNRLQNEHLQIQFSTDSTGEGVRWKIKIG